MVNCLVVLQIFCEWKTDKLCKIEQNNIWLYLKTSKVFKKIYLQNESHKCWLCFNHVFASRFLRFFLKKCCMFEALLQTSITCHLSKIFFYKKNISLASSMNFFGNTP